MTPTITIWQEVQIWLEDDETKLQTEIVTYYMLCALYGSLQGMGYGALLCLAGFASLALHEPMRHQ